MANKSAGLMLYRFKNRQLEIFLVHPGGPYWTKKDAGSWSIPKGEFTEDEDVLEAAKREFKEETGFTIDGDFVLLCPLKQPSGKVIHVWAVEGDCDPLKLKSNTFRLEWPPRSGKVQDYPEVDKGNWFNVTTAKEKISKGQLNFIDQLVELVGVDER